MLLKTKHSSGKTLYTSKPLLLSTQEGYTRPAAGGVWFSTTTTVWRIDELVRRRVRDWKRLTGETGHDGERAETFRKDHDSVYTATYSVFPAPLIEWILLRYGGPAGGRVLDAFAGGTPRAVVSSLMGYHYTGFEIRQAQIEENKKRLKELGLGNVEYVHGDGRFLKPDIGQFDHALNCPPYHDLEKYSDQPDDLSNMSSYEEFRAGIAFSAMAHFEVMKPGAFVCVVVGPFRNKKTGELIDFPGHVIEDYRDAGFIYWQQVVLSKNFGSAAQRSTTSWSGMKLVPIHEFLLVFRMPGWEKRK